MEKNISDIFLGFLVIGGIHTLAGIGVIGYYYLEPIMFKSVKRERELERLLNSYPREVVKNKSLHNLKINYREGRIPMENITNVLSNLNQQYLENVIQTYK